MPSYSFDPLPITLPEILSDQDLKSDLVHPNAQGYQQIAENIYDLLKRQAAL